jgi:L-threonylcarbamoyladenylate synthase
MSVNQLPSEQELAKAAELLRNGKLVAFPTETVYGLGADATNETAVQSIFKAKGRPSNNPLIVHVASFDELMRYTDLSRAISPDILKERLVSLKDLWPGPLSVIVPKTADICEGVSAGGSSVALRIPRHPMALKLIAMCGKPIAAPSANPSSYISPTTAKHVQQGLGDKVDYIVDGGPCSIGLESTVLSLLSDKPTILRPGAITKEDLELALGCSVQDYRTSVETGTSPLLSPGLLAKHYSPKTKVRLIDSSTTENLENLENLKLGAILFSANSKGTFKAQVVKILSETGDLNQVAANLFSALRELDVAGLDLILIETCEPIGLGAAIMDRLLRAAAH